MSVKLSNHDKYVCACYFKCSLNSAKMNDDEVTVKMHTLVCDSFDRHRYGNNLGFL